VSTTALTMIQLLADWHSIAYQEDMNLQYFYFPQFFKFC